MDGVLVHNANRFDIIDADPGTTNGVAPTNPALKGAANQTLRYNMTDSTMAVEGCPGSPIGTLHRPMRWAELSRKTSASRLPR